MLEINVSSWQLTWPYHTRLIQISHIELANARVKSVKSKVVEPRPEAALTSSSLSTHV